MSAADAIADAKSTEGDPAKGKGIVLYDGACALCQRAVKLLRRLDWFGRFHYQDCRDTAHLPPCAEPLVPEKLLEQMHLVTPDRKRAPAGFAAFRWMAWRMLLALPIAPLLYLPGAGWVGNKVYLWIAKNRYNLVPCRDGVCQLPRSENRKREEPQMNTDDTDQKKNKMNCV